MYEGNMPPGDDSNISSSTNILTINKKVDPDLYKNLLQHIEDNIKFFKYEDTSYSSRYSKTLLQLKDNVEWIQQHVGNLTQVVHLFDLDEDTPGNGYRSFLMMLDIYIRRTYKLSKSLIKNRKSLLFRADHYYLELEAHASVISSLKTGLVYLIKMLARYKKDELFSIEDNFSAEELLNEYGNLDQTGFYGRCTGFYYHQSMRKALQGVNVIMASFSDLYQQPGGALSHAAASLVSGSKYVLDPELRAQQIVQVAQNASVEFIKAFWGLTETHLMKQMPSWVCSTLNVAETLYIPPVPVTLTLDGKQITIPIAESHGSAKPIRCRLLSYTKRQGQPGVHKKSRLRQLIPKNKRMANDKCAQLSDSLLIHCHGGGFISQSPDSHEIYLREWAKETNVPILSIDYSLAPEAPFPRALEEITLVYAWALNNLGLLGTTGENICVAGDSAGGSLVMSLLLKCIDLGIRVPDGAVVLYAPLLLDMVPSPSRLMSCMDPLIPLGFMLTCLDAYAGVNKIDSDEYENEPKNKEERIRKTSTISEYLESGMHLIRDLEKLEAEENSNEGTESEESFIVIESEDDQVDKPPVVDDYVEEFIKKYNSDSSEKKQLNEAKPYNDYISVYDFPTDLTYGWHQKCCRWSRSVSNKMTQFVRDSPLYQNSRFKESKNQIEALPKKNVLPWSKQQSQLGLSNKFQKVKIRTRDPFMSPIFATDQMLLSLPPLYLMSLHYDPCLDDSVMLARRLKQLNKPFQLKIVDGLPHGFLNFSFFIKEANEASKICLSMLKQALKVIK